MISVTFVFDIDKWCWELLKVAVGPKRSTNRNLKEIITIECSKTVIFQPSYFSKVFNFEKSLIYALPKFN